MSDHQDQSARPRRRRRVRRLALSAAALVLLASLFGAGYYLYVRVVTKNFHEVVPGRVYRSAQPSGAELKEWTARYGLRTVISLRAPVESEEEAAAAEVGVRLIGVRLAAARLPPTCELRLLIEALEGAPRPILIHCAGGADRTGVASVLAAMAVGGQDYQSAKAQLSLRYLQLHDDPERITGLFDLYERDCLSRGVGTAGWEQFKQWALQDYVAYFYRVQIDAPGSLHAAPGQKLPLQLTITNRADRPIPCGPGGQRIGLAAFLGRTDQAWTVAADAQPIRLLGGWTILRGPDIGPGQSVTVAYTLRAPREPGRYDVGFDLAEHHGKWFGYRGSPVARCELTVEPARDGADTAGARPQPTSSQPR